MAPAAGRGSPFVKTATNDQIEGAWTLLYHVPTLLLAGAAFMLQEMPRFEIPPSFRGGRLARAVPGAAPGCRRLAYVALKPGCCRFAV
jgi:hypothetical protein